MTLKTFITVLFTVLCSLTMVACGGGGGASSTNTSSTNTSSTNTSSANTSSSNTSSANTTTDGTETADNSPVNTWVAGQYKSAQSFSSRCQTPRSNANYQDLIGSVTDENNWIRSWSHETYLWYNELPDIDPATISDPIAYFDRMKTSAKTASGKDKDQFHFTWDTEEYNKLSESGVSAGFGASFTITSNPQRLFVTYTEPNSPAANASIGRGAEVLAVDNVYIDRITSEEDENTVNSALFPSLGQTHTFIIKDLNTSTERSVTLTSVAVSYTHLRAHET